MNPEFYSTTPCLSCSKPVSILISDRERRHGTGQYCSRRCAYDRFPRTFIVDGEIARIPMYKLDGSVRAYAVIDVEDAARFAHVCWFLTAGYASRHGEAGKVFLHRELMGLPIVFDGREVDHIDRDYLNDRRSNLRIVSHAANHQNLPSYKGASSSHRGVSWDKDKRKWSARAHVDGRTHFLGRFDSEEDAGAAAREARASLMAYAID